MPRQRDPAHKRRVVNEAARRVVQHQRVLAARARARDAVAIHLSASTAVCEADIAAASELLGRLGLMKEG